MLDWLDIAKNNGCTRRIVYFYGDQSGMKKIASQPCKGLNLILKNRLLTIFKVFRDSHPKQLKYYFGPRRVDAQEVADNADNAIPQPVTDLILDAVFDGDDIVDNNETQNLRYLKSLAAEFADENYTNDDSSVEQLRLNLISLIGQ